MPLQLNAEPAPLTVMLALPSVPEPRLAIWQCAVAAEVTSKRPAPCAPTFNIAEPISHCEPAPLTVAAPLPLVALPIAIVPAEVRCAALNTCRTPLPLEPIVI